MVAITAPSPAARPAGAHHRLSRPARPGPEVYRRRRFVAAAVVAGVVLAGLWSMGLLGRQPLSATGQAPRLELVERTTHVVQPGDTLWSIARRAQASGDIRPLVDRLAAQTGGRPLQVGDRITLP